MKTSPIFVLAFLVSTLLVAVISQNPVEAAGEWCVADRQASKEKLEAALNWACAQGSDICLNVQQNQPCYLPNTLEDHASYAFNGYYQKFKSQGAVCDFGGIAKITNVDPSYGSCKYDTAMA
ncbi:hypothetical protein MKW98_015790 [Papaver atlanticum]|uniref:X8 domain-containing protein n=1 Tax=Papaver atlanticum TaxID=357466 RepID=A0AAD4SF15_9MAGN|nr:hypothetical protein MKW98_015790 [Papaver atlanticum]